MVDNDDIREACFVGDLNKVMYLIEKKGVSIDDLHPINNTTPLYWAVKGGYTNVIQYLLSKGANPGIMSKEGISVLDLARKSSASVKSLFNITENDKNIEYTNKPLKAAFSPPPIFIQNPYTPQSNIVGSSSYEVKGINNSNELKNDFDENNQKTDSKSILIYIQVPDSTDVIEVELKSLTFAELSNTIREEFQIDGPIKKIYRLPNILLRKDQDLLRLKAGEKIGFEL